MSTQTIELEGFEIELNRTFTAIEAGIIGNWLIVRVRIAQDWATTSMSRRCCAYGA